MPTANNLTACQTSCLNITDCRGIDYNPGNPPGWRCFQIKDASASISHNVVSGVSHYDVTNNCATGMRVDFPLTVLVYLNELLRLLF